MHNKICLSLSSLSYARLLLLRVQLFAAAAAALDEEYKCIARDLYCMPLIL